MHQPQLRVPYYVTSSPKSSWSLSLKSTQLVWHPGFPAFGRHLSSNPKIKPFHRKLWIVHTSTNPKENNITAIYCNWYVRIYRYYIYMATKTTFMFGYLSSCPKHPTKPPNFAKCRIGTEGAWCASVETVASTTWQLPPKNPTVEIGKQLPQRVTLIFPRVE